jgi:DNA-damage-inducible protein J
MNSAVINVKTHPDTKAQAQKVAQELGLSLSSIVNAYLKQLIQTKKVEFSVKEEPSEYLIQALKESQADIKAGRVSPTFDNAQDALSWLNNPKKKYQYENTVLKKI